MAFNYAFLLTELLFYCVTENILVINLDVFRTQAFFYILFVSGNCNGVYTGEKTVPRCRWQWQFKKIEFFQLKLYR